MSKLEAVDIGEALDWDPLPNDRIWFRNRKTGDRGYKVRRDGVEMIRLDRGSQEIILKMAEFDPDHERRPINRGQLAIVAFEADRALCRALGKHKQAAKQWPSLSEEERRTWLTTGPTSSLIRKQLFKSINDLLSSLAG